LYGLDHSTNLLTRPRVPAEQLLTYLSQFLMNPRDRLALTLGALPHPEANRLQHFELSPTQHLRGHDPHQEAGGCLEPQFLGEVFESGHHALIVLK